MKCSIAEALQYALQELKGKERPRLQAELLLASLLHQERVFLHLHSETLLDEEVFKTYKQGILRLKQDEPLEYLLGKVSFYGYEWQIISGVLIPRPETEILVQTASTLIENQRIQRVFEFGVGSGVISITLALLHPSIQIIASDIDPLAIELSNRNLKQFSLLDPSLSKRVTFIQHDIFKEDLKTSFDLLISNPPYIARGYPLPPNVLYEPETALFGGEGGEEILYALIDWAREKKIAYLACEMGYDQRKKIETYLQDFCKVLFFKDLSQFDRSFIVYFNEVSARCNKAREA